MNLLKPMVAFTSLLVGLQMVHAEQFLMSGEVGVGEALNKIKACEMAKVDVKNNVRCIGEMKINSFSDCYCEQMANSTISCLSVISYDFNHKTISDKCFDNESDNSSKMPIYVSPLVSVSKKIHKIVKGVRKEQPSLIKNKIQSVTLSNYSYLYYAPDDSRRAIIYVDAMRSSADEVLFSVLAHKIGMGVDASFSINLYTSHGPNSWLNPPVSVNTPLEVRTKELKKFAAYLKEITPILQEKKVGYIGLVMQDRNDVVKEQEIFENQRLIYLDGRLDSEALKRDLNDLLNSEYKDKGRNWFW